MLHDADFPVDEAPRHTDKQEEGQGTEDRFNLGYHVKCYNAGTRLEIGSARAVEQADQG